MKMEPTLEVVLCFSFLEKKYGSMICRKKKDVERYINSTVACPLQESQEIGCLIICCNFTSSFIFIFNAKALENLFH